MDPSSTSTTATTVSLVPQSSQLIVYGVMALFVVARFAMRELKERKISLARIFVAPVVLAAIAIFLLWFSFTKFVATETLLVGETLITLGIGCAVGLLVGHFTTIRLGEKPGFVYVLGSWKTVAIWIGALALRYAARFATGQNDVATQAASNAALVVMIAAALLALRYRILIDAKELIAQGNTAPVRVI